MLSYVVDFYCHELMLAIEVDGSSHDPPEAKAYDSIRQKKLETHGVRFLRFRNEEITRNINAIVDDIKDWITREAC
jgi:very-short-patch-repair endonuclease